MGTKDFFDLFKLSILKNSWLCLLLIFWLVSFAYIDTLANFLPQPIIGFLANIQRNLPQDESWLITIGILRFVFWVLSFLLFKELYERFKNFIKRGESYKFTSDSWNKDWIYNGKPKLLTDPLRLRINSSRAGCLYNARLWKNFEMEFQMRFLNYKFRKRYDKNLGIILRADDLENYFMLEIFIDEAEDKRGIWLKPHVRYQGMWEAMSEDNISNQIPKKIANLDWFKIKLIAKRNTIIFFIENDIEYKWFLPTHVDINHIESGIKDNQNVSSSKEEFGDRISDLPRITFRNAFGMIGFRAHLYQGAEIKNLKIRNI